MRDAVTVVLGRFGVMVDYGLREILAQDPSIRVIAGASHCAARESAGEPSTPNVLILDEASVFERSTLKRLRATQPRIGLIVLASHPTGAYREQMLAAGAICVCKDATTAEVLSAVHLAAIARPPSVEPPSLTAREAEVLGCLRLGYSYAETAAALYIGVETVRTHSARIRCKLGVRSKHELTANPSASHANSWRAAMRQGPSDISKSLQKITP